MPRPLIVLLGAILALAAIQVGATPAAVQTDGAASAAQQDVASYQIEVSLDPTTKQLRGQERITYRNPSSDTLTELWLRLYLNAFRSADTAWMRESGSGHRGFDAETVGWIRLERLALADGTELALPSGGDSADTIVRLPLTAPLGEGESLVLDVTWTAQLPRVFARTGYADDFFMVGQWYPKLAVYERGRWDTEPWHANAEFFADFGDYDLAVTVPSGFVTGASGVRQGETQNSDGTKTTRYRAERVTDVAWTAWPRFQVANRALDAAGQRTDVELLLPPEEQANAERHWRAIGAALDAFGTWFGPYPWPKLTVVVPPAEAGGAGGMEYPTLVTTGGTGVEGLSLPFVDDRFNWLEIVTIHEIAHEWFPMQIQSNEATEAWLDEGFADYMTIRLLSRLYGQNRSLADLPLGGISYLTLHRSQVGLLATAQEPLTTASWRFADSTEYASTVYSKGSLTLLTLENVLGEELFTRALRAYADRWRWRHPTTTDLEAALIEVAGPQVEDFFADVVYGRESIEYRIASLQGDTATVERLGGAAVPVEVVTTFGDGSSSSQVWDGREGRLTITGNGKTIAEVAVDPRQLLALEGYRLDNFRSTGPDAATTTALGGRWLGLLQALLQLLGQVG
ncbi:MAG: M1 family metallopeptidase [Chloroflexota bacterium]